MGGNVTGRAAAVGSDTLILVAISLMRPLPLMPYTFMPLHLLGHKNIRLSLPPPFTVADTFHAMTLPRFFPWGARLVGYSVVSHEGQGHVMSAMNAGLVT